VITCSEAVVLAADTAASAGGVIKMIKPTIGRIVCISRRQPRTSRTAEPADQMCAAIVTLVWDDYMVKPRGVRH